MSPSTAKKLGLLCALYLAQGLPYGFFLQALPVMLRQRGLSLPEIGLASLLALPWAAKFLMAPFADRLDWPRVGRRRGWIVPLQAGAILVVLALAFLSPQDSLAPLLIGVFLINALSAAQDVGADGLAVDLLTPDERGLGNGVQVAAYRVGMILGGGALLVLFSHLGWGGTFSLMAALMLGTLVPIVLHREAPPRAVAQPVGWWREWAHWARRPGGLSWLGILVAYKFGDYMAQGMLRPMLVDQGLSEAQLGWIFGGVGFTAGLAGALLGGAWANRFSARAGLLLFGALQAAALGGYLLAAFGLSLGGLVAVALVEHLTGGMATAVLFTRMMDATRPDRAATDYTVQASLVVIATGAATALSGFTAQALGYPGHFALSVGLAFAGLLLVARSPLRILHPEEDPPCPSPSIQAPSIR